MEIIRGFRPFTWLAIGFVKAWRLLLSPLYGDVCKYRPTCSAYGLRALQVHGVARATPLIVWRILRCNPWSNGGYDPVPGTPEAREWAERQAQRAVERGDDAEQAGPVDRANGVEHHDHREQTGETASSSDEPDAQLSDMRMTDVRAGAGRHCPEPSGSTIVPGPHGPDDAVGRRAAPNQSRTSRSGKYPRDDGQPSVEAYTR